MVGRAREAHPQIQFVQSDIRQFTPDDVSGPSDAVLSNAALHWVPERDQCRALSRVADVLSSGGQIVAEFGGRETSIAWLAPFAEFSASARTTSPTRGTSCLLASTRRSSNGAVSKSGRPASSTARHRFQAVKMG